MTNTKTIHIPLNNDYGMFLVTLIHHGGRCSINLLKGSKQIEIPIDEGQFKAMRKAYGFKLTPGSKGSSYKTYTTTDLNKLTNP